MFDGEVGDAARRIEPVGRRESIGRADVEAACAGAAAVRMRFVGRDVERGVDLAQEQPRAMSARDEVGVLALPADPGALRQRLLHHRRSIDEYLHRGTEARDDELSEMLQHALHHVVIVAVAGIDRDGAAIGERERGERIVVRRVRQAERDHAARVRPQVARIAACVRSRCEPAHVAVLSGSEKFGQSRACLSAQFGAGRSRPRRNRAQARDRGSVPLDQRVGETEFKPRPR